MNAWTFITADDEELNDVLSRRAYPPGYPWPRKTTGRPNSDQGVGVLIASSDENSRGRPAALVVSEEISRRLFGRYAQLRSDLSPLSAWMHILDWYQFEHMQAEVRRPDLAGFEASWIGLAVAEALILSERPLGTLRLAACLATPSYAVARARALWPNEPLDAVLRRYDLCQHLIRANEGSPNRLRDALLDVWRALVNVTAPLPRGASSELRLVTDGLIALRQARIAELDEAAELHKVFHDVPQAQFLVHLESMPPEIRVHEFDRLVAATADAPPSEKARRNELQFLAGYLATVAAGGAPSLSMAERLSSRWPQIPVWAYVLGGVGEMVTWTSSFDGLGRLVARDLLRPFRLDDPPTSDFALAEATFLVDRGLQDPLVHLKVKQSRVVSVALMPGVNIAVAFGDGSVMEGRTQRPDSELARRRAPRQADPLAALADALAPYLLERLGKPSPRFSSDTSNRSSRSRGAKRDTQLPLDVDRDRSR